MEAEDFKFLTAIPPGGDALRAEQALLAYLKTRVAYDPETGLFAWLRGKRKGTTAGTYTGGNGGYLQVTIDGKTYSGARLAWLFHYGFFPTNNKVRFINGDVRDTRIANLYDSGVEAANEARLRAAGFVP